MSAQIWMAIGVIGFAAAAALIFAAVLLFIRWKIPAVIGELSGRTEKKQIKKMRQEKAEAEHRVHYVPPAYERGMEPAHEQDGPEIVAPTDVLEEQDGTEGTAALSEATDVLAEIDPNATTILSEGDTAAQPFQMAREAQVAFNLVKSVVVVHTSEVIE